MNQRAFIAAAVASLLSTAFVAGTALAQAAEKEKCYGVAKVGQNDCANLTGTHSCAGQAKVADAGEWNYVAKGSCKTMNGLSAAEAKAKLKI